MTKQGSAGGLQSQHTLHHCSAMEGAEELCLSLGLGEIPLLNAENRELNRRLQAYQVPHCISTHLNQTALPTD